MKPIYRCSHAQEAGQAGGRGMGLFAGALAVALTLFASAQANAVWHYTPGQLNLNRTATKLTTSQLSGLNGAHTGFRWNSGDNSTLRWRPQGIAGYTEGSRKFLIVSWAGQEEANYDESRGARISVVDVTSMSFIKYRHVLLVTQGGNVFSHLHAGGITVRHGLLHVADTREGRQHILTFDLGEFERNSRLGRGYRYILRQKSSYRSPVKPSFLSFDWSRNKFLVGSFTDKSRHGPDTETRSSLARLAWYRDPSSASTVMRRRFFYKQMQGAGAEHGYLWTTHSYGRNWDSHLHVDCYRPGQIPNYRKRWTYPPGLEDIHISQSSNNIWMLTEFGTAEGSDNNRDVFATKRFRLRPSGGCR